VKALLDILKCIGVFSFFIFAVLSSNRSGRVLPSPEAYKKLGYTMEEHIEPCSAQIEVQNEYIEALKCMKHAGMQIGPYLEWLPKIPECYIIKRESPDVFSGKHNNFIRLRALGGKVLGFYTYPSQKIFLVENSDMVETWRHEVQHYVLDVLNIKDKDHSHLIWAICESRAFYITSATPENSMSKQVNPWVQRFDLLLGELLGGRKWRKSPR
jgi:hypothetical protein